MEKVSIIGIDLAKHSFQLHGARADGSVAFRKKLSRGKVLEFLASAAQRGGDGGLRERSLLGPRDREAGARGQAGSTHICEAVREATFIPRHLATLLKIKGFLFRT